MKYLGLDWGLKKVGLAISEGDLASPMGEILVNSLGQAIDQVLKIVKVEGVDQVLIGLPESGQIRVLVERAVGELQKNGVSVETVDESLSTRDAVNQMVNLGLSKKSRKNEHAYSASIILQGYLDDQSK